MQTSLITCSLIKNEEIYNDRNFNFDNYKEFDNLMEFIYSIKPERINIDQSSLILYHGPIYKVAGLFKKIYNCEIIITLQNNLFIFEGKINSKQFEIYNTTYLSYKNCDEKNYPYRFEISELKKGILYNSTSRTVLEAINEDSYKEIIKLFS
jgi:hypothetical protein